MLCNIMYVVLLYVMLRKGMYMSYYVMYVVQCNACSVCYVMLRNVMVMLCTVMLCNVFSVT